MSIRKIRGDSSLSPGELVVPRRATSRGRETRTLDPHAARRRRRGV